MDFTLLKDNVVVGRGATLDPNYQPPEGFTLGPADAPDGYAWNGTKFVPPAEIVRHVLVPDVLSPAECDAIIARGSDLKLNTAAVVRNGVFGQYMPDLRRSAIAWIRPEEGDIDRLFQKVWGRVDEHNRATFRLPIERLPAFQFTRYEAELRGHFEWHTDALPPDDEGFERKLTTVALLSDPESFAGGTFEIQDFGAIPFTRGSLLIFPSAIRHRVLPVTKGERYTLVAWILGPASGQS